jgi:hypothetical protein
VADLINAIAEVFATLFRAIGFVGRPRQRAAIHDDLALLRELDEFAGGEFGPGTAPHIWLVGHIYQQVGELAGLDFAIEKRKADLSSVFISGGLACLLGWVSYYLLSHGFGWWVAFPITLGSLLAISTIGMITEKEPVGAEGNLSEFEDQQTEDLAALTDIEDLDAT